MGPVEVVRGQGVHGDQPEVAEYSPNCRDGYAEVGARRVAQRTERIEVLTDLRDRLVRRMPWLRTAR